MKVTVYNQKGEKTGDTILPKEVFGLDINPDLLFQVVNSQRSNRRQKTAKAKDRSEVRGGGRKPWRQKGTGRARHGSIRSPLWIGGGVTFGPNQEKAYKKNIPAKMRRKALLMALSGKAKDQTVLVLDDLKIKEPKTKLIAKVFEKIIPDKGSALLILPGMDKNLIKATRNINRTSVMQAKDLNVLDLLSYKYIVMPKEAVKVIKETFIGKK